MTKFVTVPGRLPATMAPAGSDRWKVRTLEDDVVLERRGPSLAALVRWSGLALVAGGLLMVVAIALHPSRETTATILQAEVRLVAAHALFTLSYLLVLLGLPGLYAAESVRMGRLGLVGFLLAFTGTMLIAVSGNFGFLAPVLAAQSPQTIDAINATCQRWPSTGWPSAGSWSGSWSSAWPWPRRQPSSAPPACSSPWVPRPSWLDSPWPSSSHRRYGRLPSSGAWPSVPALPGPGINCGRTGVLTCDRPPPGSRGGRDERRRWTMAGTWDKGAGGHGDG
jgi:hypothetical protein